MTVSRLGRSLDFVRFLRFGARRLIQTDQIERRSLDDLHHGGAARRAPSVRHGAVARRARNRALLPWNADRRVLRPRRGRAPDLAHARGPRVRAWSSCIPAPRKPIWVNVPVVEAFAAASPFRLRQGRRRLPRRRRPDRGRFYPVRIPEEPAWYSRTTSSGIPMSRIGVLQGNYLGVYVSNCLPLLGHDALARLQVLHDRQERRRGRAGAQDSRGRRRGGARGPGRVGLRLHAPEHRLPLRGGRPARADPRPAAVRAVRPGAARGGRRVHRRAGHAGPAAQVLRVRRPDRGRHRPLLLLLRVRGSRVLRAALPGKGGDLGQEGFFEAMEYTAKKLGRGRVSGEIIAGLEPIEATMRGIDRIVAAGAFPTVCIFRPTVGSELENDAAARPRGDEGSLRAPLRGLPRRGPAGRASCRSKYRSSSSPRRPPASSAPTLGSRVYERKLAALRQLARPYVAWKTMPRGSSATRPPAVSPAFGRGNET